MSNLIIYRHYRVTIDLKARDSYTKESLEAEVQQSIGDRNNGIIPLKVQAEVIEPGKIAEDAATAASVAPFREKKP